MNVKNRNNIIRKIAESHCEGMAYESEYWRKQMAYWIRQVRQVAA